MSQPEELWEERSGYSPASALWQFPESVRSSQPAGIMGALAGFGVGGAVGGLVAALVGMGIPEYEAQRYEGRIKNGGVLLSEHCDTSTEIDSAKEVLKASGAEDISSAGEKSVSTHSITDKVNDARAPVGSGRH